MTFLNPFLLWSLLGLIPLIGVYFLKVRPRTKKSNAYFLWEHVFAEKRPNRLLNRLRDFWSLLLMALAFAAIALAMANPQLASDRRKDVLLVVDHSASMSARDGGKTRLERAQSVARNIVRAFNGAQRAAVAQVGHDVQFLSHFTDNPRELMDAILAIQTSNEELQTSALASILESEQGSHRVILISDGCFNQEELPAHIELMKVGETARNIGIVKADMQYLPGAANRLGFYFQVASTYDSPQQIDLLIKHGQDPETGVLRKLIPIQVQPGLNQSEFFTIDDAQPGGWIAKLDVEDALEQDDRAYLAARKPDPISVGVVSDDRFFFENSVVAFSQGSGLLVLARENPQVVLAKSTTPASEFSLIFTPSGNSQWWSDLGEELSQVIPHLLVEDHPALRHLEPLSIPYAGARRLTAPDGAQVWVVADEGTPLIYQATQNGRTAIVVNMDPVAAEFYFSAWFPVLVHSSATYLAGREEQLVASYPPRSAVPIPGAASLPSSEVTLPDGQRLNSDGKTTPPLADLGFYQLQNSDGRWLVACSLLSPLETQLDNKDAEDTSRPISRGWPIGHLLTVLALFIVSAESLLYHRRKVG